jgi:hypothetical protein
MIETPTDLIKPEVQLTGEDGSAFAILGACRAALKDAGNSQEIVKSFMDEATSGGYDHLLQTAMAYCEVA